jgi:hypothetical protein
MRIEWSRVRSPAGSAREKSRALLSWSCWQKVSGEVALSFPPQSSTSLRCVYRCSTVDSIRDMYSVLKTSALMCRRRHLVSGERERERALLVV